MPAPGALDSLKMGDRRGYIQFGGPRPNNRPYFYGGDTNYFVINGVSIPVSGGISPINVADPNRAGGFIQSGKMRSAPDLPAGTLVFRERTKSIPRHWIAKNCLLNAYNAGGRCTSLSDFDYGWDGFIEIYSGGEVTSFDPGDRSSFEDDTAMETTLGLTFDSIYAAGSISWASKATGATAAIVDVTYANRQVCGDCGPADDGTRRIYALETGGGATKPVAWYSLDGGDTWASLSIAVAANAEAPNSIRVMGNYLIVVSPTAGAATQGGLYYVPLNPATGAPSGAFVKVTTGFVATFEPRDIVVLGPKDAFLCCDSGVILYLTDPTAGVTTRGTPVSTDLGRIASDGNNTIVAVGASGVVVKSTNRGQSFAATTTSPSGTPTLTGVAVLDENRFWIISATGAWWTQDGAETAWTAASLPLTLAGATDIVFATQECGYIAYASGGIARILATVNAGASWTRADLKNPRIQGMPTATITSFTRLACPKTGSNDINANFLLAAPAAGAGAAYVGSPNLF